MQVRSGLRHSFGGQEYQWWVDLADVAFAASSFQFNGPEARQDAAGRRLHEEGVNGLTIHLLPGVPLVSELKHSISCY